MRVLLSAGDVSGDIHAAGLIRELRSFIPELEVYGIGGDRLTEEGMEVYHHVDSLSVVGIGETFGRIRNILKAGRDARRLLKERQPDVVVLVDYPGFNLRLAKTAHNLGIKVFYYIPPQIWAWGRGRVRYIKRWVDTVITLLPFEDDFYKGHGIKTFFVGHPLLDEIGVGDVEDRFVALLPGSRMGEIKNILPLLLSLSNHFPDEEFIIPLASDRHEDFVRSLCHRINPEVAVVSGSTYEILSRSKLVVTASGTVTLECAIIGVPFIIVYKVSLLTWLVARALVDVPYIGLVNLVAGRRIVKEFLQSDAVEDKIVPLMRELLGNKRERECIKVELKKVRETLGEKGASKRAAKVIAEGMKG